MKKIVFFAAAFVFVSAFCFAADQAEGFWISWDEKTNKATAGWEIYITGNKLYGKILSVAGHPQDVKASNCKDSYRGFPVAGAVNAMTVVGTPWIFDMTMDKPGNWSGGRVIDPDSGNDYRCEITFHPRDGKKFQEDTLEMRGKIGPFGRSQYWKRCTRAEAAGVR